jgi:signal transduction histidine kinase/FixJ family two-component response regulator
MASVSKYTSLKLLISYLSLLALMFFAVWFLYNQQTKLNNLLQDDTTDKKYLVFTELIKDFYETDNLSKAALQSKEEEPLTVFLTNNSKLVEKLDTLKPEFFVEEQGLLDTLKLYLKFKEKNIIDLRDLQNNNEEPSPFNEILGKIKSLEVSKGKLFIENFVSNTGELTDYQRRVAEEYVAYLNSNVPKDSTNTISFKEADSILRASKIIIEKAQKVQNKQTVAIKSKEIELLKNELIFTRKLSDIIQMLRVAVENDQKKIQLSKLENQNDTLKLMRNAAFACVILVVFFFFLLSMDFLKNKNYRQALELQKKKAELLSESREQLMATVSHDIKAPLQSVMGYSEQLLKRENQFENREQLLKIKSASHYIQQLVSDLLDYVRMEKGKVQVAFQDFDLNELLEETAQSIADLHQKETVDLIFKLDETEGILFKSDFNKLRQILYNLIGNAYKFTANGSITIETKIIENRLLIAVEDTGVGIPKESFEKIFKPFTQENSQVEVLYGGTGLGLSISKRLVDLLDGKLILESTVGKGSKFTINLPLNIKSLNQQTEFIVLNSCVILDDDASQLQLTKSVLESYFKEIHTFSNGNLALEFIAKNIPSLIFSDIQMPIMDGYTFLAALKNNPKTQNIPVIAISGNSPILSEDNKVAFDSFLTKPYTANQLLGLISKYSGQKLKIKTTNNESIVSILKTFLGDNEIAIQNFLKQYSSDLLFDIELLKTASIEKNLESIEKISHKLQTMIGQLKNVNLANRLKNLEDKISNEHNYDKIHKELLVTIKELEVFVKTLQQEN